jgi:RND family efflux transporter MFP subunit
MTTKPIYGIRFVLVGYLLIAISCNSTNGEQSEGRNAIVRTMAVATDKTLHAEEYIGTIEGENMVDVSFLVAGNIEHMYVREGQNVQKGQPLARLERSSLKNAHDLALASLKQAKDAHQRMSAMHQSNSLPEIQYIDSRTKLDQAIASEAIANKNLQDGTLVSPFSGVVGTRYLEPGASVMPGTPVYNVMGLDNVLAVVPIPEGEIANIIVGDTCSLKVSALGDETFFGKITEKGIAANPISHTYDVKVQVRNPHGKMMSGMVCRVYLPMDKGKGNDSRIIVPLRSVQVAYSGKRFVWIKDRSGKAEYREVELGPLYGNGVQVTNGLMDGDELIVDGYQNISEGTVVTLKNQISAQ